MDIQEVLDRAPWSFNKELIVLTRWRSEVSLKEFTFNEVDCWIQLYDIPLDYCTKAASKNQSKRLEHSRAMIIETSLENI